MATQNPLENEGTYPLPEAQLDRFLMHLNLDYPSAETEIEILRQSRKEAQTHKHLKMDPHQSRRCLCCSRRFIANLSRRTFGEIHRLIS